MSVCERIIEGGDISVIEILEAILDAIAHFFESLGHSSGLETKPRKRPSLPSKKHVI